MKLPTPTNYGTSLGCGTCSGTEWGLAKDTYPSLDTGKCYKAVIITTNNAASSLTACSAAPAGITSATLATITSPLENAGMKIFFDFFLQQFSTYSSSPELPHSGTSDTS